MSDKAWFLLWWGFWLTVLVVVLWTLRGIVMALRQIAVELAAIRRQGQRQNVE